ncbi:MAG: phospholipid-binding protein MlaC [Halioglobus sp.]
MIQLGKQLATVPAFIGTFLSMLVLLASTAVSAESGAASSGPHALVADTTERVMRVVTAAEEYANEDPERYYGEIQGILDPLIDYRGFARNVMGPYASSKRYRSLDEAGREQLKSQLNTFTLAMQQSLIRTYSKGLLAFGQARIELAMEESEEASAKRASVKQLIYAENPQPYVVLYQMGRNKADAWKLRNVIIESVNLGEIYRDQFLASARDFDGDLDKVISNWTTVTVDVES